MWPASGREIAEDADPNAYARNTFGALPVAIESNL
jgi:hypothetical protein